MKNVLEKIKKVITQNKRTPFVREYLFTANARANIYVSSLVALLEIWMLVMMFTGVIQDAGNTNIRWLINHTIAYVSLFTSAVVMLVYSILYLKGKVKNQIVGRVIKTLFSVAMILFGLFVSYTSSDRGGQVFAFITVVIFIGCILVWHPVISFVSLTVIFLVYIYLQSKLIPISFSIKVNAFTTWLALFAATVNSYHQKRVEAHKDERLNELNACLEKKSLIDDLTSLPNMKCFYARAAERFADPLKDIERMRLVFMDVENFKNYNEKYGFAAGTEFLKTVAQIVSRAFKDDLTARFSDDHFVALADAEGLEDKIKKIQEEMTAGEDSVQLRLKAGIYAPKKRTESPNLACDRARYACESIKKHFGRDIVEYDSSMQKEFKQKQYIINNLDKAIKKGFIKVFYQPVVWAENGNLCGVEALARWEDPEFGLMPPSAFVPILEEYHLIHKLDLCVMETACKDLKEAIDNKRPVVPISVNFSRLDFELVNPAEELERCAKKYGVSRLFLHIEITESALLASDEKLRTALETFRKNGNSLWLDDFGSGYSGLNVLKDYSFDLMKIDMAFLSEFSGNEKSQPILTSIVALAQKIGMQTLTEGVETEEEREFLKSIGCQRLQGYLFGRPMPKSELSKKIASGVYVVGA